MNTISSEFSALFSILPSSRKDRRLTIVVAGIGNPIRGDDGFGPRVIKELSGKTGATLFDCGTSPENYIGPIKRLNPDVIIFLDAVNFESAPGTIKVVPIDDVSKVSLSTHTISAYLIAELLSVGEKKAHICVVGIQPKHIGFGSEMSKEVEEGVRKTANNFIELFPLMR